MTLRDLFEAKPIKPRGSIPPMTPAQTRARADRERKKQEKISNERKKSACRIRDIEIAAS